MDNKQWFAYWVRERENIRASKAAGDPKPWSNDPTMQQTYFCNVRREDDKVTKAIRKMYTESPDLAAPNMMLARMVNKPSSLLEMSWPWDVFYPHVWKERMSQPGSWGNAYIVSTNGRRMAKHDYVAGLLETAFKQLAGPPHTVLGGTLSVAHRRIQALQGMGSFMSAQVVADLKNTPEHPLAWADDWWTWASHGPGSLRGLGWFHNKRITPSMFDEALVSARQWCYTEAAGLVEDICNQDLQNCFCEYDKFMRVSTGAGKSKRRYSGGY